MAWQQDLLRNVTVEEAEIHLHAPLANTKLPSADLAELPLCGDLVPVVTIKSIHEPPSGEKIGKNAPPDFSFEIMIFKSKPEAEGQVEFKVCRSAQQIV